MRGARRSLGHCGRRRGSALAAASLLLGTVSVATVTATARVVAASAGLDHGTGAAAGTAATGTWPGWTSLNWSGYAVTSGTPYRSVGANWTVPTVTGPNGSYSAAWVGIDGFTNGSLIQTGTEQDVVNGAGQYSAWWSTSSENFVEQTITSGCTNAAAGLFGARPEGSVGLVASPKGPSRLGRPKAPGPGDGSGAPIATTGSATNVSSTSATLNGTVNPNGLATTYVFEFGTTTSFGSVTAVSSAGSGRRSVALSTSVSGLSAATTYYYELVATNADGTADGGIGSFTTSPSSGGTSCGLVEPGDPMSAVIAQSSGSTWDLSLTDGSSTHGWSFTTTVTYNGPGASAEWILEAPSLCRGSHCTVATLANYGSMVFDQATVDSVGPALVISDAGEMVNTADTAVLSIPSSPDASGDGFTVAYGSTQPSPPPGS
jgi:hypothetical protein